MTLSVEKIHCVRNTRSLFQDINFKLFPGDLLQVVGSNGVGKSSLLRIIAGLLQPESGVIFWNDGPIAQSDFQHHLFYLGHALAIKPELTVKENILYSSLKIDFPEEKIKHALQFWSLENHINHLCGTLSQGQRQRVALARLLLSDAKIWILDEPFANLDAEGILQFERLLQSHVNDGIMVMISTHRKIIIDVKQKIVEL